MLISGIALLYLSFSPILYLVIPFAQLKEEYYYNPLTLYKFSLTIHTELVVF